MNPSRHTEFLTVFGFTLLLLTVPGAVFALPPESNVRLDVQTTGSGHDGFVGPIEEPAFYEEPDFLRSPSGAMSHAQLMLTHHRNQIRLQSTNGNSGGNAAAQSTDLDVDGDGVLDLAVVVDNGSIIIPARPDNFLDLLPGGRIRYTPTAVDQYRVEFSQSHALDPSFGLLLGLPDDGFSQVALTAPFPFLGTTHSSIFVGSDGHITFGVGDGSSNTRDAARHIGGPPRVSALLTDLDPTCSGTVHADVRADRVVVTWNQVVHFQRGFINGCGAGVPTNTMQAILYADGMLDFVYGSLDTALISQPGGNRQAVTGIAEGNAQGPLKEVDMTADLPLELQAGAIFEEFGPAVPEQFDIVQLSQEFYTTHGDKYDFLVMFTDFEIGGGGTAFSRGVKNTTLGLSLPVFDASALFGSAGELESFIWMNNINLWFGELEDDYINPQIHEFAVVTSPRLTPGGPVTPTESPYETFGVVDITGNGASNGYSHHARAVFRENPNTEARASRGAVRYSLNSAISIMFQEADHRWAAFPAFVHPTTGIGADSLDLLGRQSAHWSSFFNTRVVGSPLTQADGMPRFSGMEGNAIIELAVDSNGQIVDKNNMSRVIDDPEGKLTQAVSSCQEQGRGLFLTEPDQLIDGATELDQYLMGVRRAEEVSPFWYVDDPTSPIYGTSLDHPFVRGSTFNVDDIAFCGTRVDLTVNDISDLGTLLGIPTRGPRVPAIGDENDVGPITDCDGSGGTGPCVDVKTMAWILLVRSGSPNAEAHMPAIRRLDEFRRAWQTYVDGPGLGGRNADGVVRPLTDPDFIPKFDASLEPAIH